MTQQTMQGGVYIPNLNPFVISSRNPTYLFETLDAANEKYATIFQAPKSGEIAKVCFRTSTVVTGDTVDVRLETVSTTDGNPTGTLFDTNTNASQVILDGDDNTWFTVTLTGSATVIRGDVLALVIAGPGTGGYDIDISKMDTTARFCAGMFPYESLNTGAWVKDDVSPVIAVEYDDGSYEWIPYTFPLSDVNAASLSDATTPDEIGLKFKLPFPVTVGGFWVWSDHNADVTYKLYDSDGSTVLESLTVDKDQQQSAVNATKSYFFDSQVELNKDTFYRLTMLPTDSTTNLLSEMIVDSAAVMDALEGGQDFHRTERTDAGGWTDTTTKRPFMGLFIQGFGDDTGGGGGGATWFAGE